MQKNLNIILHILRFCLLDNDIYAQSGILIMGDFFFRTNKIITKKFK